MKFRRLFIMTGFICMLNSIPVCAQSYTDNGSCSIPMECQIDNGVTDASNTSVTKNTSNSISTDSNSSTASDSNDTSSSSINVVATSAKVQTSPGPDYLIVSQTTVHDLLQSGSSTQSKPTLTNIKTTSAKTVKTNETVTDKITDILADPMPKSDKADNADKTNIADETMSLSDKASVQPDKSQPQHHTYYRLIAVIVGTCLLLLILILYLLSKLKWHGIVPDKSYNGIKFVHVSDDRLQDIINQTASKSNIYNMTKQTRAYTIFPFNSRIVITYISDGNILHEEIPADETKFYKFIVNHAVTTVKFYNERLNFLFYLYFDNN